MSPFRGKRPRRAVTFPPDRVLLFALVFGQLEIEAILDLGERHATSHLEDAVGRLEEVRFVVIELVAERPDDFLERIFAERESDCSSVLVENHGALLSARLQLAEEVRERHRVGNEEWLPRDRAEIGRFAL